ncbi:unnamed protein product [Protopolystoma xenopodis]|uniref:Major facilitator superfamily (MFS) profile domain-containing protein n=1 Tax=Protopolystoma xenopodis TaxID=117903 RepID=A0A3S5AGA2_9PLAT|nr:unnamed protein product [Protopolystoma xenopodis]
MFLQSGHKPDIVWTPADQGLVDSSFFYGYLITQIPGGVIASKFPANKLFGIAVGGTAFINLFQPLACRSHFIVVMLLRFCQGLIENICNKMGLIGRLTTKSAARDWEISVSMFLVCSFRNGVCVSSWKITAFAYDVLEVW